MRKPFDPRLYLVIGPENCTHHPLTEVVEQALQGGVTLIQYRDKHSDFETQVENVIAIMQRAKKFAVPVLVNDRPDIAQATKADGVHLGQGDGTVQQVRDLLGKSVIIGLTVRNPDHIRTAPVQLLDYLGIGGVFASNSKPCTGQPLGIRGLAAMCNIVKKSGNLPTTAIAGIDESNCEAVLATGVNGLAVVSAICGQRHPFKASQRLREKIDPFFKKHPPSRHHRSADKE